MLLCTQALAAGCGSRRHVPDRLPGVGTLAVWEWRDPQTLDAAAARESLEFLSSHHVNTVYLHIGECLGEPGSPSVGGVPEDFDSAVTTYIRTASHCGIRVHALCGESDWIEPSRAHEPMRVLDYVADHNASSPPDARFRGVQFDVEPYRGGQPEARNLTALLDLAREVTERMLSDRRLRGLSLGYAVPFWYDTTHAETRGIAWQGRTDCVFGHLTRTLSRAPEPYVAVMSYRHDPRGKDGSIALSRYEVDCCSRETPNVRVVIGQETSAVQPEKLTFRKRGRGALFAAATAIADAFADSQAFEGIAVHDAASLQELRP